MISDKVYKEYLDFLLQGNRLTCTHIVRNLIDQSVPIKTLYTDLFQKSLYRVGELWEFNRISVAKEHLATAITEGLLSLTYPMLFDVEQDEQRKKMIISCAANEYHQIGGKMVADICELNGWDTHFLGANTPVDQMLEHIQEVKPQLVGLSLSVYFNIASLKKEIEVIRSNFTDLDIFIGGQAFQWGGIDIIKKYPRAEYMPSLDKLERALSK